MSALADNVDTNSIVSIAESHSELFAALIEERPDLAFLPQLWNSNLSLLDKLELFDALRFRGDVDKQRLFEAIPVSYTHLRPGIGKKDQKLFGVRDLFSAWVKTVPHFLETTSEGRAELRKAGTASLNAFRERNG